jgi:hypothetical protein
MDGFRLCTVVVTITIVASTLWASAVTAQQASGVNRGVVEIETSSAAGWTAGLGLQRPLQGRAQWMWKVLREGATLKLWQLPFEWTGS